MDGKSAKGRRRGRSDLVDGPQCISDARMQNSETAIRGSVSTPYLHPPEERTIWNWWRPGPTARPGERRKEGVFVGLARHPRGCQSRRLGPGGRPRSVRRRGSEGVEVAAPAAPSRSGSLRVHRTPAAWSRRAHPALLEDRCHTEHLFGWDSSKLFSSSKIDDLSAGAHAYTQAHTCTCAHTGLLSNTHT